VSISIENHSHELIRALRKLALRLGFSRPQPQDGGVAHAEATMTSGAAGEAQSEPPRVLHIHHGTEAAEHLLGPTTWQGRQ
jgi:hypothetical protein